MPKGSLYALAQSLRSPVETLGVDLEQDLYRVPCPRGDLGRGTPPLRQVDTAACRRS